MRIANLGYKDIIGVSRHITTGIMYFSQIIFVLHIKKHYMKTNGSLMTEH